ncbi:molybdenum cofactor cytidylyltransferase [Chloroflexota bacterium]
MLSAILLAAGEAKRMGKTKQLMPWRQSTMVEQAIDSLLGSAVDEVIVVVGHKAEEVTKVIADKAVKLVVNPDYEQGMSTSIKAGLNLLGNQIQAVMLALGDQPFIDSQTTNRLMDEFYRHDKGIAIPTYRDRRGHPVIFAIKYKEELLGLTGDIGGRQIIENHADDVLEVPVETESIFTDIDTLSDYQSHLG